MKPFSADWPIPRSVRLGPGVRIRVRVVTPEESSVLSDRDGCWIYHPEKGGAILIDGRLPVQVQRYVLLHELLHALHDVIDVLLEDHEEHFHLARRGAPGADTTPEVGP